jgi:ribosomal protein S18 acetylase RimI-like enzyme
MNVASWREIPASRFARIFGEERHRWLSGLHWDFSDALTDVERARVIGQLPGFVALDGDRIAGWSYHLTHRNAMLLGHVSASDREATRLLIEATLASDEARATTSTIAFGFFDAVGVEEELGRAGLLVEPYAYLSRDLTQPIEPARRDCAPYDLAANRAVARLLQGAYLTSPPNRPFAIGGSDPEWIEYVTQLTYGNGCGVFDPASSVIREGNGLLDGVALISAISSGTAHLCQLAVNPGARRIGLGVDLLAAACARARQNGRVRMTLTVASSNTAALGLYRRFGFTDLARFTFARR